MIPGASLGWHWTHVHKRKGISQEMSGNKWDVLTLQGGGRHALVYGAGLKTVDSQGLNSYDPDEHV